MQYATPWESTVQKVVTDDDGGASSTASHSSYLAEEEAPDHVSSIPMINKPLSKSSSRRPTATTTDSTTRSLSDASSSSSSTAATPTLRGNLMRMQENRNPAIYYETVKDLGAGSMGSVSMVTKKSDTTAIFGGSSAARRRNFGFSVHDGASSGAWCFSLPLLGSLLRRMFNGNDSGHHRLMKSGKDDWFVVVDDSPNEKPPPETRPTTASRSDGITNGNGKKKKGRLANKKEIHYALKTSRLDTMTNSTFVKEISNEFEILKTLDHPNIVRPIETFTYQSNQYIVMELCAGGDLYARDPYSEGQARRIVSSVASAVKYMHDRNVVHRDLKYENIMFCNHRLDSDVKVIDFGLSKKYFPDNPTLKEGCVGTFYSMAPEVIKGSYTAKADIWSLGVIAFMLLSSRMPFDGKDIDAVVRNIVRGRFEFRGERWENVSKDARRFVRDLIAKNPDRRPTAAQALKHEWICHSSIHNTADSSLPQSSPSELDRDDMMKMTQASIESFAEYSKLKKLALMIIAHTATSEEISFLRTMFDRYDRDRNGKITFDEFRETLEGFEYEEKELEKLFAGCDLDGTGVIQYTEFLAATVEANGAINEKALAEAFDRIDSDDSGYISAGNLRKVLGENVPSEHLEEIILEAENGLSFMYSEAVKRKKNSRPRKDHKMSYKEFLALWNGGDKKTEALKKIKERMANKRAPLGSIPEISIADNNGPISESLSDISSDAEVDPISESQFREEKMMSVRRYADI